MERREKRKRGHNPTTDEQNNKPAMSDFYETPVRRSKTPPKLEGVEYSVTLRRERIMRISKERVEREEFAYEDGVDVVILEEGVKSVGYGAFHGMPRLREIFAENAKSVKFEQHCFSQLPQLEMVKIAMVSVPPKCFFQCPRLKTLTFEGSHKNKADLTMGEYALAYCSVLQSISNMPEGMVCEKYAFQDCTAMEGTFKVGGFQQENVPTGIFYGCENITKLEVREGTLELGKDVCNGCMELKEAVMPRSLMVINDGAFRLCRSLKALCLGENLRIVGSDAFRECSGLETVESRATERVDFFHMAFGYCTALVKFTVPEETTKLACGMFYGCSELQEVTMNKALEDIGKECFSGTVLREVELSETKVVNIGDGPFPGQKP